MNRRELIIAAVVTSMMAAGWYAFVTDRTEKLQRAEPPAVEIDSSELSPVPYYPAETAIRSVYDRELKSEKPKVVISSDKVAAVARPVPRPELYRAKELDITKIDVTNEIAYINYIVDSMPLGSDVFGEPVAKSIECLAKNIFNEGRSEIAVGQVAIALVTMNRAKNKHYPNTICKVVYQKACKPKIKYPVYNGCTAQFTWTWDGNSKNDHVHFKNKKGKIVQTEVEAWARAVQIAADVVLGRMHDFTDGALHYYNPKLATPRWAKAKHFVPVDGFANGIIGNHRFMIHTRIVNSAAK